MTNRKVKILVIAFLVLALIAVVFIRFHHHTWVTGSIDQSKAAHLFEKQIDISLPGFYSAWIERQCDNYSVSFFVYDFVSWTRIRDDYVLVCSYDSDNLQRWPRYNNVPMRLGNLNSGMGVVYFKTLEEFDLSNITIGPGNRASK